MGLLLFGPPRNAAPDEFNERAPRLADMGVLTRLLNVPALMRHLSVNRAGRSVWDPADDLELALYDTVFGNNFLHYGYFPNPPRDPESISLSDAKKAMDDYASLLVRRVRAGERVLDIGCGMGGLLARLDAAGARPTGRAICSRISTRRSRATDWASRNGST